MDALRKLLLKKKQEGQPSLSPMEQDAKLSVLQDLHKQMSDAMSDKLGGLKKVTVAADSNEDLSHGLDKAKEALHGMPEDESDDEGSSDEESPEHELSESPEEEHAEHESAPEDEDMSEEELNAQLEHLMALKKKKGLA